MGDIIVVLVFLFVISYFWFMIWPSKGRGREDVEQLKWKVMGGREDVVESDGR